MTIEGERKTRELAADIDDYLNEWGKYPSVVIEEIKRLKKIQEKYQRKYEESVSIAVQYKWKLEELEKEEKEKTTS